MINDIDENLTDEFKPSYSTKRDQRGNKSKAKKRAQKTRSISRLIRGSTLSIRLQKNDSICNKDLSIVTITDTITTVTEPSLSSTDNTHKDLNLFRQQFFPDTEPQQQLEYSRLPAIAKLMLCQLALQYSSKSSRPFVFRLPKHLHGKTIVELRKIIQRKLKSKLNRTPLFLITAEYSDNFNSSNKIIDHINGEINLEYPIPMQHVEEQEIRAAFREIYGKNNAGAYKCIKIPTASRIKWEKQCGKFYAVYNWIGYITKQEDDRQRVSDINRITKIKTDADKSKFYAISKDLNRRASYIYSNSIQRKNK